MFLCCKRVGINAHNFMAEHTLIRASEGKERSVEELKEQKSVFD